ncbi:MAG: hypothetical protein ABIE55_03675 [Candidatus Aenigmatarchaeota archaeon]
MTDIHFEKWLYQKFQSEFKNSLKKQKQKANEIFEKQKKKNDKRREETQKIASNVLDKYPLFANGVQVKGKITCNNKLEDGKLCDFEFEPKKMLLDRAPNIQDENELLKYFLGMDLTAICRKCGKTLKISLR